MPFPHVPRRHDGPFSAVSDGISFIASNGKLVTGQTITTVAFFDGETSIALDCRVNLVCGEYSSEFSVGALLTEEEKEIFDVDFADVFFHEKTQSERLDNYFALICERFSKMEDLDSDGLLFSIH